MPRPGYRWSRRRGVLRFARLRKPVALTLTRYQDQLEPQAAEAADIRHELVSRVRGEILAGTYDDPEKFESALDRMLGHLSDD